MTPAEESEFDQLPEALRLALMDRARLLGDAALDPSPLDGMQAPLDPPAPLSMREIGEAAAIGRGSLHWRYVAALHKLRREAQRRDL